MKARLTHSIDFGRRGQKLWSARVAYQGKAVGRGSYGLPVYVSNNGYGPALLLTAGAHGDEFEGPACLWSMIQAGVFDSIKGRVIILPALNPPALDARQRRSPIDGQDMNRSYPGDKSGSPTDLVADFVSTEIVSQVDAVFDLHAGGNGEFICPSIMTLATSNQRLLRRSVGAMHASGLPVMVVTNEFSDHGMLDGEALRQGKVFGCAELGSAATLTVESLANSRTAVMNILCHLGMLESDFRAITWTKSVERLYLRLEDERRILHSPVSGFFLPRCGVGDRVEPGDPIGDLIMVPTSKEPVTIRSPGGGVVYVLAGGGPVATRQQLAVVAEERLDAESLVS